MKPEAQRIAMAEACGWEDVFLCEDGSVCGLPPGFTEDQCPEGADEEVPDYLGDLNAMHEAESALTDNQQIEYAQKLTEKFSGFGWRYKVIHATASQRAEAFLKTIGKWVEE